MKILRIYHYGLKDEQLIIISTVVEKWNSINGKTEGQLLSYSKNGNIHALSNFINNLKYGIEIGIDVFNFERNIIKKQKISSITYYKDDNKYGKYYSYYLNGRIAIKHNYENNYSIGKEIKYYDTGIIKSIAYYNNGLKINKEELFFKSGELNQVFNYKDGKINGKNFVYYKTGEIKRISNYLDGVLNGISELYEKNDKIIKIIKYLDGNIIN